MPEVWLPYLDVNVSFKASSSQIDEAFEPAQAPPPQPPGAEYYIGDGLSTTDEIARSMGLRPLELQGSAVRESVIDGELIRFPQLIERSALICSVRVDPAYGFTGPHWLFARAVGPEEAFLKRSERAWRLGEELEWFSRRVLDESGASALCYFGRGQRGVSGRASDVLGSLSGLMTRIRARERRLVVASAGGLPYDETFSASLYGLYQALLAVGEGGTLVYLAGSRRGLGDDGILRHISGHGDPPGLLGQALELARRRRVSVYLVSGLPSYYIKALGFVGFSTLQSAVEEALRSSQKVTVIKEASTVLVERE